MVGPNGAGKSTLLNILAGRTEPDAGTVSRKKGLRFGFLEQTPYFPKGAKIFDTLLEKCPDPDESQAKVFELMAKLELTQFDPEQLVQELSGGWQKRVALARELALEPEILFLDEPTNHLDLSGILWLEEFLAQGEFALLMVTHDRLFLQRVATRIFDLDPRNPNYLLNIAADYSQYLETKELELAAQRRHEQVQKNRLRRETEWLRRGSIARQTKQSARIQGAHDLQDEVERLSSKNQTRTVDIEFGAADRSPKKLIEAIRISKSYDQPLFKDLDLLLTPKTRLGLLGDNGCGKSTLIRILLGQESADAGEIKRADGLQVAYFEQSRETLDHSLSVLKNICPEGEYVFFQGQSLHVRSYLDRFYFSGAKAEMPAGKLSGGEQARLRLAQLMLRPGQILVLDEPTNDLDTETLDSLEESLNSFNGAVILVTHDRYFLDAVANQILAFPRPGDSDRSLQKFASYFQWENWRKTLMAEAKASQKSASAAKTEAAKLARLSFKEKFELENMEGEILKLEKELADLEQQSQAPEALADHKKLTEVHTQLAQVQAAIDLKYQRWAELEGRK